MPMKRIDDDIIERIMDFPEDVSSREIWRQVGVDKNTVKKYRSGVADALKGKKKNLTKEEKKKLELLELLKEIFIT